MGRYEEAIRCYHRSDELGERRMLVDTGIASCYALMGKREEAMEILNNLIEYSKGNYVSPVVIAWVFAVLGEKDQVFVWLEKAFREHDPALIDDLKIYLFDPVRSDPRFAALLRKIGLEK
jgi:tetratricopeptide (TPR) repeat protein